MRKLSPSALLIFGILFVVQMASAQMAQTQKEQYELFWKSQACTILPTIAKKSPEEIKEIAKMESYSFKNKRLKNAASPLPFNSFLGVGIPSGATGQQKTPKSGSGPFRSGTNSSLFGPTINGPFYGMGGFIAPTLPVAVTLSIAAGNTGEAKKMLKGAVKDSCYVSNPYASNSQDSKSKLLANPFCRFYEFAIMDNEQFDKLVKSISETIKEQTAKFNEFSQLQERISQAENQLNQLYDNNNQKDKNGNKSSESTTRTEDELQKLETELDTMYANLAKQGDLCLGLMGLPLPTKLWWLQGGSFGAATQHYNGARRPLLHKNNQEKAPNYQPMPEQEPNQRNKPTPAKQGEVVI